MQELIKQLAALALLQSQSTTPRPWTYETKGNTVQSYAIPGVCSGISPKTGNAVFIAAAGSFDYAALLTYVEGLAATQPAPLADAALSELEAAGTCTVPPAGWACKREAGHEGPCAAFPVVAKRPGPTYAEAGEPGYQEKALAQYVQGRDVLTLLTDNVPSFFDGDGCHGTDLAIGFAMPDGRKILLADLEPEEISKIVAAANALPGLLARLHAAEAPKWVSVEERLPERTADSRCSTWVLCRTNPNWEAVPQVVAAYDYVHCCWIDYDGSDMGKVHVMLYWQPLPAATTVKGGPQDA